MKKIGIWLDQKVANIVVLDGDHHQVKTINSEIETRIRVDGEKNQSGRFGEQFLDDEKSKKHKFENQLNQYLHKVYNEISDADEIMIFGPAQTKVKLEKLIYKKSKLASKLKDVLNSDQMTENQKVAFVKKYFK